MTYQEQLAAATVNQALYDKLLHAFPNIYLQEPQVSMSGNIKPTTGSEVQPARQILEFAGIAIVVLFVGLWVLRRWRGK